MKVAYNNCFGGFGLSDLAIKEYAKRKGVALTAYKQTKYEHCDGNNEYVKVDSSTETFTCYLTKDLGDVISELPDGFFYYERFESNESRCDKDLIDIIETLGYAANGSCASLAIREIPDNTSFEVTDYDGNEDVVPPRTSW